MRIGVLTFHRAYNYGAFLQCFSLVNNLKKNFPEHDVEVIDYSSRNMINYYKTDLLTFMFGIWGSNAKLNLRGRLSKAKRFLKKVKNDTGYVKRLKERNSLFSCALQHIPLSNNSLISDDADEFVDFINSCNYDLIIVGSDAVWNDYQTTIPNLFYLHPEITAKRASYAASIFGMNYKSKTLDDIQEIAERIKLFKFIGVRDSATEQYVKFLDSTLKTNHTCDPSIILDLNMPIFDKEKLRRKLILKGLDFSRPVYGIMGGDWLGKIARDIIGDEAQLVAIYESNSYADLYLNDLSPWEWAIVFSNFQLTFTHFFHGTLFSLKNGTPTMSIEMEGEYSANFDSKILDVLKRLNLVDYRYTRNQAEQKTEMLKEHFKYVIDHLGIEKERIAKALSKEAVTVEPFMDYVSEVLRGI